MSVVGNVSHIHDLCQMRYHTVARCNEMVLPAYDDLEWRRDLEARVHQAFLESKKSNLDSENANGKVLRKPIAFTVDDFLKKNQLGYQEALDRWDERRGVQFWSYFSSQPKTTSYWKVFLISFLVSAIVIGVIFGILYGVPIIH